MPPKKVVAVSNNQVNTNLSSNTVNVVHDVNINDTDMDLYQNKTREELVALYTEHIVRINTIVQEAKHLEAERNKILNIIRTIDPTYVESNNNDNDDARDTENAQVISTARTKVAPKVAPKGKRTQTKTVVNVEANESTEVNESAEVNEVAEINAPTTTPVQSPIPAPKPSGKRPSAKLAKSLVQPVVTAMDTTVVDASAVVPVTTTAVAPAPAPPAKKTRAKKAVEQVMPTVVQPAVVQQVVQPVVVQHVDPVIPTVTAPQPPAKKSRAKKVVDAPL